MRNKKKKKKNHKSVAAKLGFGPVGSPGDKRTIQSFPDQEKEQNPDVVHYRLREWGQGM